MDIHHRIGKLVHLLEYKSVNQFATTLGFAAQSLGSIINGKTKPSYDVLERICRFHPQINTRWLLLDEGEPLMDEDPEKMGEYSDKLDEIQMDFNLIIKEIAYLKQEISGLKSK